MQVIISDTSYLIDLKKVSLIEAFLLLPYEITIPDILFFEEITKFTSEEKSLLENGLRVKSISGKGVRRARKIKQENLKLTINECFAFVLAESISGSILLTGDKQLKNLADTSGIEYRGVLWIIEKIYEANLASLHKLYSALLEWQMVETVRLPNKDLNDFIERFKNL